MEGRPRGGPGPAERSSREAGDKGQRQQGRQRRRHEEREPARQRQREQWRQTERCRQRHRESGRNMRETWRQKQKKGRKKQRCGAEMANQTDGGRRTKSEAEDEAQMRETQTGKRQPRQGRRGQERHGDRCQSSTGNRKAKTSQKIRNWARRGGQGLPRKGTQNGGWVGQGWAEPGGATALPKEEDRGGAISGVALQGLGLGQDPGEGHRWGRPYRSQVGPCLAVSAGGHCPWARLKWAH